MADRDPRNTPANDQPGTSPPKPGRGKSTSSRRPSKDRSPVKRGGARIDRSAPLHQARVLAMQALFEEELTEHGLEDILTRVRENEDEAVPEKVATHAARLAQGVQARQAEIDPHIERAAPAFPIPQLASIDRAVLRVAVYELLFEPQVPFKAAINEAVEIAKRYGGPNSGSFVNGVLRTISERLPAERTGQPPLTR